MVVNELTVTGKTVKGVGGGCISLWGRVSQALEPGSSNRVDFEDTSAVNLHL